MVQWVTKDDLEQPETRQRMAAYESVIKEKMDDTNHQIPTPGMILDDVLDSNDEPKEETKKECDDYTKEAYNSYLGTELLIPSGDTFILGRVIKRERDKDGHQIGRRHANPLDTHQYKVIFGDGSLSKYSANLVAENMMAQSDSEGRRQMIFKEITNHCKNLDAVSIEEGFTQGFNGNRHSKKTTWGWDKCVEWQDGSTSWIPLKEVKDSNPLELVQYAIGNWIDKEPAFTWWVPEIMRWKNRIISRIKSKYWKTTHKFGI